MPDLEHSNSSSLNHYVWVVFTLTFVGGFMFLAIMMGGMLLSWHNAQSWVEVPAHILRTQLRERRYRRRNGEDAVCYVNADYTYDYHGQKYASHDVWFSYSGSDGYANQEGFDQDAYRELSGYQKMGKPFRCYVNPAHPEQALLYRDLHMGGLAIYGILALVIVGSGFWFMTAIRQEESCSTLVKVHPAKPWMWRPDWAAGQLVFSDKKKAMLSVLIATVWNMIFVPMLLVLLGGGELCKSSPTAWFISLCLAVGLGFIIWAAVLTLRWQKFGTSVFRMASVPGFIGGQLAGVIQTSTKIQPADGFYLTIMCIRRITIHANRRTITREDKLWRKTQTVDHEIQLRDNMEEISVIPVDFQIPACCRPTDNTDADDEMLWRLTAATKGFVFGYSATFEVPMFNNFLATTDASGFPPS